jgi:hypothetical protein
MPALPQSKSSATEIASALASKRRFQRFLPGWRSFSGSWPGIPSGFTRIVYGFGELCFSGVM